MKNSIKCPVCGRDFDPRTPVCHISRYHQAAKNCELEKIRDARRQHFNQLPRADGKQTERRVWGM